MKKFLLGALVFTVVYSIGVAAAYVHHGYVGTLEVVGFLICGLWAQHRFLSQSERL
jgi:hypothetical protein